MAMASGNTYFQKIRSKPDVFDTPQSEDTVDLSENVTGFTHSAVKPKVAISSSVRELLECPVCLNAMYPPIHQCSNGHTLCSSCKPRVHNRCPTCWQLGNIRCLALEKVAASLQVPCKYLNCKPKHESQSVYRPFNCPYAGSEHSVVGDIPCLPT